MRSSKDILKGVTNLWVEVLSLNLTVEVHQRWALCLGTGEGEDCWQFVRDQGGSVVDREQPSRVKPVVASLQ